MGLVHDEPQVPVAFWKRKGIPEPLENLVDENCDPFFQTCGTHSDVEQVMLVSVGSGAIAAGIGTLIGRERWETLNLPLIPVVIVKRHGVVIGTRIGLAF